MGSPLLFAPIAALLLALAARQDGPPTPPAVQPPAPASIDAPKPQVAWRGGFEESLQLARSEQRPLLVLFHPAKDADADAAAAKLWRDEKVVAKTAPFLCVLADGATHEEAEATDGGKTCQRWGGTSCGAHQQAFTPAARELIDGATSVLPQLVLCTGEGRVLARRAFALSVVQLCDLLDDTMRMVGGPGGVGAADPAADAARVTKALEEARKARSTRKAEALKPALEIGSAAARDVLLEYARKGDDDATRAVVIEAIAARGDYLLLEPLLKLAKEKQEIIALAATDALAKLRLPEALEELRKLLPRYTGNDHGRVLRALAACGPTDAVVRELLVKKARGNDQNIRAHALIGMGALVPTPEVAALLGKAIFDRLTVARACAVYAAGKGRYEACREELAKQAAGETHVDLKELATTALAHLDHDPAATDCCNLENELENFIALGDTRR